MKKTVAALCMLLMILGSASIAYAELIPYGNDIIFDNANDLYWYNNPGDFSDNSRDDQLREIGLLSVTFENDVYNQWAMATQNQVEQLILDSDVFGPDWRRVFIGTWEPLDQGNTEWELTARSVSSQGYDGSDVALMVASGSQTIRYLTAMEIADAWVVQAVAPTNGGGSTPAPVPEPATMLLLGTGLIGLAGLGRKRLKS